MIDKEMFHLQYQILCIDDKNILFCFFYRPDPTNFHEGMRILTERKASSDEIEAYVKTVQTYEVNHSLNTLEKQWEQKLTLKR